MTIHPTTILRTYLANLPYNRAHARRTRTGSRRRAEIADRLRVCRESVEAGERAGAETVAAREARERP